MSKVPTQPDNERRKQVLDSLPPGTPAPEMDADGNIVGTEDYGGAALRPEIDANGNIVNTGGPVGKFPPSARKGIADLIERLKNWRTNDLMPWLMGMARYERRRADQKAQISWANKYIQSIIDIFPKRRGRPPKLGGPQTAAQRKQHQRGFEKDFGWVAEQLFPIITRDNYLVIETSHDDELPLFDLRRATIISGAALRAEMEAHHKDYPDPKEPPAGGSFIHRTEKIRGFADGMNALVLEYPDHVRSFVPDIRIPTSVDDVLRGIGGSSLNNGRFIKNAPAGTGRLFYAALKLDPYRENKHGGASLEEISDMLRGELVVGADGIHRQVGTGEDIGDYVEDPTSHEPACPYCHVALEVLGDAEGYDLGPALAHLSSFHSEEPEYQQLREAAAEHLKKVQRAEKQRERRLKKKQKRCREDHDVMFARRLKVNKSPSWYVCGECGANLCQGLHAKLVEEELAKRTAYLASLSYQEHRDAIKEQPKPVYCRYCHAPIFKTDYEPRK